jgi:purine-nucleoside phosphorylase
MNMWKKIVETTEYIHQQFNEQPVIGIVLGTGLGGLVSEIEVKCTLDYKDIPNFPSFYRGESFGQVDFWNFRWKNGRCHARQVPFL